MNNLDLIKQIKSLNSEIERSVANFQAAEKELKETLARERAKCEHAIIAQYAPIGTSTPARICYTCRLIENGTKLSGRSGNGWDIYEGRSLLGDIDGRVVESIDNQTFRELRIDI